MATKKATSKPHAAIEKPPQRAARKIAAKSKPMAAEGLGESNGTGQQLLRGSTDQRLQAIETTLARVLKKLEVHGMKLADEADEETETDEPEQDHPEPVEPE